MEKYNLLSVALWSACLTPPKPIVFDNHTHYPLTETNGTRQGPGERERWKLEETPKQQSAKTGKSHCVWSDFHFCARGDAELKRCSLATSRLIDKLEISSENKQKPSEAQSYPNGDCSKIAFKADTHTFMYFFSYFCSFSGHLPKSHPWSCHRLVCLFRLSISTRDVWISEELRIQTLPLDELELCPFLREISGAVTQTRHRPWGLLAAGIKTPRPCVMYGPRDLYSSSCTESTLKITQSHPPQWDGTSRREEISLKVNVSLVYLGFHAHL